MSNDLENSTQNLNQTNFNCKSCNLVLNSQICFEQHLLGQRHKKNEAKLNQTLTITTNSNNLTNDEHDTTNNENNTKEFLINLTNNLIIENKNENQNSKNDTKQQNFKCEQCNIEQLNETNYIFHINGQKHKKRLKNLGLIEQDQTCTQIEFRCDLCDLNLISKDQLAIHQFGKKHLKLLRTKQSNNSDNSSNQTNSNQQINKNKTSHRCEICDLTLISQEQLTAHLAGKKHLKKLSSFSILPSQSVDKNQKIKNEDDEKFANLNIAWDKYKIDPSLKQTTGKDYEFYCNLCSKYMQRKLQLVDHLKSRKHHFKIYEKRLREKGLNPSNKLEQSNDLLPKKKKLSTYNLNKKTKTTYTKRINFVSASTSYKSVDTNQTSASQAIEQAYMASQHNNSIKQEIDQNLTSYPLIHFYQSNQQSNQHIKRKQDQNTFDLSSNKISKIEINQMNQNSNFNQKYNEYGFSCNYSNYPNNWNATTNNNNNTEIINQQQSFSSMLAYASNSNEMNHIKNFTNNLMSNVNSFHYANTYKQFEQSKQNQN